MKYSILLFLILFLKPVWGVSYYGLKKPSGYKKFIYSNELSREIFRDYTPKSMDRLPTKDSLNLYFSPVNFFSFEFIKRDDFLNYVFNTKLLDKNSFNISQFNIISNKTDLSEISLLHGGAIYLNNFYFFGLSGILHFSQTEEKGVKLANIFRLPIFDLTFENILLYQRKYRSPVNIVNNDEFEIKTTLIFSPAKNLETKLVSDITVLEKSIFYKESLITSIYFKDINDLKNIKTKLEVGIVTKKLWEYYTIGNLELTYKNFIYNSELKIRYINAPLLYTINSIGFKQDKKLNITAGFYFNKELNPVYDLKTSMDIYFETFTIKSNFIYPLLTNRRFWRLEIIMELL